MNVHLAAPITAVQMRSVQIRLARTVARVTVVTVVMEKLALILMNAKLEHINVVQMLIVQILLAITPVPADLGISVMARHVMVRNFLSCCSSAEVSNGYAGAEFGIFRHLNRYRKSKRYKNAH